MCVCVCRVARHLNFPSSFDKEKNQANREALDPKLPASLSGSGRAGRPRWAWAGREGAGAGRGGEGGRRGGPEEDLVVDCCRCLGFPPFGEEVSCQPRAERDNSARTQPGARARSPPPQPCHLGQWPAGRPPSPRDSPPRAWSLSERGCRPAPHRAWPCIVAPVATRGLLGAQPHIARPTLRLPPCKPHSLWTFFSFPFPLCFSLG